MRVTFMADGASWGELRVWFGRAVIHRTRDKVSGCGGTGSGGGNAISGSVRDAEPYFRRPLWERGINEIAPSRFTAMMHVMAAGALTGVSGSFSARLRDARGRWAVSQVTPLIGGDEEQIAVSLEPATGGR